MIFTSEGGNKNNLFHFDLSLSVPFQKLLLLWSFENIFSWIFFSIHISYKKKDTFFILNSFMFVFKSWSIKVWFQHWLRFKKNLCLMIWIHHSKNKTYSFQRDNSLKKYISINPRFLFGFLRNAVDTCRFSTNSWETQKESNDSLQNWPTYTPQVAFFKKAASQSDLTKEQIEWINKNSVMFSQTLASLQVLFLNLSLLIKPKKDNGSSNQESATIIAQDLINNMRKVKRKVVGWIKFKSTDIDVFRNHSKSEKWIPLMNYLSPPPKFSDIRMISSNPHLKILCRKLWFSRHQLPLYELYQSRNVPVCRKDFQRTECFDRV